jgi:hypothetical protein
MRIYILQQTKRALVTAKLIEGFFLTLHWRYQYSKLNHWILKKSKQGARNKENKKARSKKQESIQIRN